MVTEALNIIRVSALVHVLSWAVAKLLPDGWMFICAMSYEVVQGRPHEGVRKLCYRAFLIS